MNLTNIWAVVKCARHYLILSQILTHLTPYQLYKIEAVIIAPHLQVGKLGCREESGCPKLELGRDGLKFKLRTSPQARHMTAVLNHPVSHSPPPLPPSA
jgi:hypothetical protein